MLKYSKGQKISLNLTLVNNNGSPESGASVSYEVFNESDEIEFSNNNLAFNEQLGSYIDLINPYDTWVDQKEGVYFVKWKIENTTEDYPNELVEELHIHDYDNKLNRLLGLVHENVFIDQPKYDNVDNLVGARMRIYSDAESVGTNNNVIGSYKITSTSSGPGTFKFWKQEKI